MHLDQFNLLPIRSCRATCISTLMRSARTTLSQYEEWLQPLQSMLDEALSIERIAAGAWSPAFWDSEPFAVNLMKASSGYPELPHVYKGFTEALREVSRDRQTTPKLQSILYKHMLPSFYPLTTSELIAQRATELAPQQAEDVDLMQIEAAITLLRKLPRFACSHVLKTWVNSWTTSDRYHSEVRHSCFFGCPLAKDALVHYLACPALWSQVALLPLAPSPLPVSPLERLGVLNPCLKNLCVISSCYHAYHFTKAHYRTGQAKEVSIFHFCTAFNAAWPKVAKFC